MLPHYLRFVRSVAFVSGIVVGGCGDRSHIPVTTSSDASDGGDGDGDVEGDADAQVDAGPCECFATPDSGVRVCGPSDPPCAVPGPLPPPELHRAPARVAKTRRSSRDRRRDSHRPPRPPHRS